MSNILHETIQAAESVLASDGDIDLRIAHLSAYTELFNKLFKSIEDKTLQPPPVYEDLKPLAALHQQVLACAVSLLGDTSIDLQQLQMRGKAILAYTDTLPKRVSMKGKKSG